MAAIAVLTCPCHLPILLVVLGGTALGAVVSEHLGLAVIALTVLFVTSAWTAVSLFSRARREPTARESRR
jgi:mercuric ion transport protein